MFINKNNMSLRTVCIFLLFAFCSCKPASTDNHELKIKPDAGYPRWIISASDSARQTSGIIFIGQKNNVKHFLLADDIGLIHHLQIENDTVFTITPVRFSKSFSEYLADFPKKDFEEITYSPKENAVYLSIEGNKPDPAKFTKILKLTFYNNDVLSDSITAFSEVAFNPQSLFTKYVRNNIAYEGLAVDDDYLYLGLEGFSEKDVFADSTIIFVVDKKSGSFVKQINTKNFGIGTVCGLFSDKNKSLYGIDRNNKKLFHITLNSSLEVESYSLTKVPTSIPGYKDLDYVASLESVTIDNKDNIYLVDDPWPRFYTPAASTLSKLDTATVSNFKNLVPIIYRFKLNK